MDKQFRLFIAALCAATSLVATAAGTADEAKQLMQQGKYSQAMEMLQGLHAKNKANVQINLLMAECLEQTGQPLQARKHLDLAQQKGSKEAMMEMARLCYSDYDFAKAKAMMSKYETAVKNKPLTEEQSRLRARISMAEEMASHVEKIVVVDSIVVDKNDFFKAYRISRQAGTLASTDTMPASIRPDTPTEVYMPESGESMMWSQVDADGTMRLMKSDKLLDGSWDKPTQLDDMLNDGGDACYPFVTSDGQSLYYANNGTGSIGGYDIFVTRKDPDTGNYLKPQNVGMPYNSPYDDYLLVIDDNTGVGWWATDRNHIPGKLTIYVYLPNPVRENYNPDSVDIATMAAIRNIRSTWASGQDYADVLARIKSIDRDTGSSATTFNFCVSKGVTYTSLSDAKTTEGRSYLEQYLSEQSKQRDAMSKLKALRARYADADEAERKSMAPVMTQLESTVRKSYETIEYYANQARKAEQRR